MKRPFPTRRTDTITRANVQAMLMHFPELDNPAMVAEKLWPGCTIRRLKNSNNPYRNRQSIIDRCAVLMGKVRQKKSEAS